MYAAATARAVMFVAVDPLVGASGRGSWGRAAAVVVAGLSFTVALTWLLLNLTETDPTGSEWQQLLGVLERRLGDVDAETSRDLAGVAPWVPQLASALQRAGLSSPCEVKTSSVTARSLRAEAADRWRGTESVRGFSMALNRPADPADGRSVAVTARTGRGELVGVLTFVPWGRHGLSSGSRLDRLVMLLTGTTIRSVLSFPFVRPRPAPTTAGT